MTQAQIAERKETMETILAMDEENYARLVDYIKFLRFMDEQEDAEDAAYCEAHRNDPSVPLEQVLEELGIK